MLNRLCVLLACLVLPALLPCAASANDAPLAGDTPVLADDPPVDEPPVDEPPVDEPPADEPPADEPPADAPPTEEPPADEPAPESPKGADAPGDDGEPAKPDGEPAEPDDEPAEPEDEPVPAEPAPEAPAEDDPRAALAAEQGEPPTAVPAGMAYVRAGRVWIGTEREALASLLANRPADHRKLFNFEVPYHAHFLRPYFIGKYEVTNAQYHRFLQDTAVEYDTASGSLANLDEIAAHLANLSKDQQQHPKQTVWLQIYYANKDAIWAAFADRLADLQAKRPDDTIDEYATARKFRFEPLPRTLKLKFYSLRPPTNWPDMDPPRGQEDHPVRFVSYNDAERFAEWAGMHLPSEQEWEWAARGPLSPTFPWGNAWPPNALYANWGGKIVDSRYEPTTLAVASRDGRNTGGDREAPLDGDGRSWVGCHHMVGNVAEWTGSWFEPYPDNAAKHTFMGRYIKVIRGGGAGDGEMLVVRPACRNWVGGGPDAPPYPENAFQWVGFRLAAYMRSGQDQLKPIVRRAVDAKRMKEEMLDLTGYVGSVTRNWVEPAATPDNHVYVRGRSHAIVLIPQDSFLREQGMLDMEKAWKGPSSFKTGAGLSKKSETDDPFFTVGVLHTDIKLEPVLVRKPEDETEDPKKKARGRGRARAPDTMPGSCPPGTYIMACWFGRLALLTPSTEFVCFLQTPRGEDKKWSAFDVEKVDADKLAAPTLKVDADLDWADFRFNIALGGKGTDEKLRVIIQGRLLFEVGGLDAAGSWIQEDPAAALTAELRAAHEAATAAGEQNLKKAEAEKAEAEKAEAKKAAETEPDGPDPK